MHVFSQAFANMLLQKYLGFASFGKYDFRKLSRKFANMFRKAFQAFAIHAFARFRKVSQGLANGLSQGFAIMKWPWWLAATSTDRGRHDSVTWTARAGRRSR